MTELLSAAQMRATEGAAISAGLVTGLQLMERAGQGVVDAISRQWPDMSARPGKAVVLCGPGNNGGDGFVIARLLADQGWQVSAVLHGDAAGLGPDARANHDRWVQSGPCAPLTAHSLGPANGPADQVVDLVIDALFGTGLSREIDGEAAILLANLEIFRRDFGVKCVAVDIASGICADSGRALGCFAKADLTVTFHRRKLGHCLDRADSHSARVVVMDIGLPQSDQPNHDPAYVRQVEPPTMSLLAKPVSAHKFDFGHALIVSGEAGRTGAARLAARGALRIGAGLVTLAVPGPAMTEVAGQVTAIMLTQVSKAADLRAALQDTRLNALCLGPGLGSDPGAREMVEMALSTGRGVVLDGDALSMYRAVPEALFSRLHDKCILTPHGGEFARLFPDIARRLCQAPTSGPAFSKVDAARAAAKRAGCTIVFKGPDSVIAGPDGHCALHPAFCERAAPWLATAGSGDVLAGYVTGLLARGFSPMQAGETAAWLHVQCAIDFGPGLIAEDISDALPGVFRNLQL